MPGMNVSRDGDGALMLVSPFIDSGEPWRMDDAVELIEGGRFQLKGRLDRIVKIEEKRVSLPEVESTVAAHEWISGVAAVVLEGRRTRIAIVAVPNAAGRAALKAHGRRVVIQQLRAHLSSRFDAVLLPRHWRFVEQLPLDSRGKLTQARLAAVFSAEADEHLSS